MAKANVIDFLKSDQDFSLKKHLKKDIGSLIPDSLKAEEFVTAFESKKIKQALKLWEDRLANSRFAKSSNGSAIYAYLLFQNGFEVLALNHLFQNSKPKELDPSMAKIWKAKAIQTHPVWQSFYFKMDSQWAEVFPSELVFQLGAKYPYDLIKDSQSIEQLLSLPLKQGFDSFSLEWSFFLSLLKKGDMDLATKLLSWLVSQTSVKTEKETHRRDQIHLTIARLLADIQAVSTALEHYQKISPNSYFWLLAQEEMAWLLLQQKNYTKALTKALALNPMLFDLSPSMYFVLALLQLKTCDHPASFETLMQFKKTFSGQRVYIEDLLKSKKYKELIARLRVFYQSGQAYYSLKLKQPFYLIRKDQNLKHKILLYQYIQSSQLKSVLVKSSFKNLVKKQKDFVKNLQKQIYNRLDFLLQSERDRILKYLKEFHILEAELAYRHQILKKPSVRPLSYWSSKLSVYKSDGFVSFPFNKKEIWRDELSSYQWIKSSKCMRSSYKL